MDLGQHPIVAAVIAVWSGRKIAREQLTLQTVSERMWHHGFLEARRTFIRLRGGPDGGLVALAQEDQQVTEDATAVRAILNDYELMAIGPGSINLAMVIPTDAADGTAEITNSVRYTCNPWQALFSPWLPMPALSVDVDRG